MEIYLDSLRHYYNQTETDLFPYDSKLIPFVLEVNDLIHKLHLRSIKMGVYLN